MILSIGEAVGGQHDHTEVLPREAVIPLENPAINGGGDILKIVTPHSKGGARAPAFLTGFTFVELLVVVIIIGILIGITLPKFLKTYHSLALNTFACQLQTVAGYLRERSVAEGSTLRLVIDTQRHQMQVFLQDSQKKLRTYQMPRDIVVEAHPEKISFYPDGQVQEAAIMLTNNNGEAALVTTNGVFGGFRVERKQ